MDILVSDTAPPGYTGVYQLNPGNVIGNQSAVNDLNVPYNVGTEFALSGSGVLFPAIGIRCLSLPGASGLPTRASVWTIDSSGLLRSEITGAVIASPSWSGAAGSGWVQANFATPPLLKPGKYVVSVYNSNGVAGGWNAKDSVTGAWASGDYAAGIVNGPLSAPGLSAASIAYDYNGADSGSTPPFTQETTERGQSVFGQMPDGSVGAPYLVALPSQNYFVDIVIGQPVSSQGSDALMNQMIAMGAYR
jgi:hypothetical protein